MIEQAVKDFWYMAVYAAQHIGRGEVWLVYDKNDVVRAFWANVRYTEELLVKMGAEDLFREYESKLMPSVKRILEQTS